MKNFILSVFALVVTFHVSAQYPGNGGGYKPGGQSAAIGHLYGRLVDSTGHGIAGASVLLLQSKFDSSSKKKKEILLKGLNSTANGDFSFEKLPLFANLIVKISAVGYKNVQQSTMLMPGAMDKDMGNIKLEIDVNQLQNVTVTTTTSALKMDIDKKVFNVEKDITSAGGTAVDVMKNVPSVQVDIDGNVKLRNATPQIYIDGRPTTLTLDQIPADAIQSIEVITNPSAKYDASGGNAGILNIVLKKNKKTGYNGNLMAGVDTRGGYNLGGNFSVRQGKFNVTAAVMHNSRKSLTTGFTNQSYFFGDTTTNINQNTTSKNNGGFTFGRLGIDYFLSNRTTISITGMKMHGDFTPNDISNIETDSIYPTHTMQYAGIRTSTNNRTFDGNGLSFGLVQNFVKDGHQLTFDGNYFGGKNKGNSLYSTDTYNADNSFLYNTTQQQISDGTNSFLTIQSDYTNPITKNLKLEAGLRAQITKTSQNSALYYIDGNDTKIPISNSGINYKNTNNVYAAYATITSSIKNFGYQVGLRAESSNYTGDVTNTGQHFTNKYPISLFPSVFLSQKLGGKQELQLNFSRRINRPNFFQLIPYTDRTDTLNISRGNPDLRPEFTNSFEFSYSKSYGKKNNTFLASIYYKYTDKLITRYLDTVYNPSLNKNELINTYVNANSAYSYGLELTSVNYVTKWWDFNLNVNLYNSKINTDNLGIESQDAMISWFGKMNNNFKLPANFTAQLSFNYQSKTNLPINQGGRMWGPPQSAQSSSQGYILPFWSTDIAIKKTFLKNQALAVTLSVNDIFKTRSNEQVSTSPFFYQDYYRLNNPQLFRLGITYRFGKMDATLFKRQNKNQGQGMQDASQMMQ